MSTSPIWLGKPRELSDQNCDTLSNLVSHISPEGDAALFAVTLGSGQHLTVRIGIEEIGHLCALVRQTAVTMNNRQRFKLDMGLGKLEEIAQTADQLTKHEMHFDPATGDLLFVYHLRDHSPLALRVDPRDCLENMVAIMRSIKHITN